MDELKVRDIMQTEVVTVGPGTTVRELADILAKHKISGVPVVDEQRRVLGMVSEADIILQDADLHFPYYIQFLDSVIYLQSFGKFEERFRKTFGSKVDPGHERGSGRRSRPRRRCATRPRSWPIARSTGSRWWTMGSWWAS